MCGRYTLLRLEDFIDSCHWIRGPLAAVRPRYNIAPSQDVAVIPNDGTQQVQYFRWGLVPFWANDPAVGNRLINARAETLPAKPAFREALRQRRCLIPADGFFEWLPATPGRRKTPMYFTMRDRTPFAFAGLWETWQSNSDDKTPPTTLHTCVIITGQPNDLVRPIHDRMPVILHPDRYADWLLPRPLLDEESIAMLTPYAAEPMETFAVGDGVNRPSSDTPDLIAPIHPEAITTGEPGLFGPAV